MSRNKANAAAERKKEEWTLRRCPPKSQAALSSVVGDECEIVAQDLNQDELFHAGMQSGMEMLVISSAYVVSTIVHDHRALYFRNRWWEDSYVSMIHAIRY